MWRESRPVLVVEATSEKDAIDSAYYRHHGNDAFVRPRKTRKGYDPGGVVSVTQGAQV